MKSFRSLRKQASMRNLHQQQQQPRSLRKSMALLGHGFTSGHVLVNVFREEHQRPNLRRNRALDRLCRTHAKEMAQNKKVAHSVKSIEALQDRVNSQYAGENVHVGKSIRDIHLEAIEKKTSAYTNMMCRDFTEMGIGTYKGENGKLYVVQLFRGEPRPVAPEKYASSSLFATTPLDLTNNTKGSQAETVKESEVEECNVQDTN